MKVVLQLFYVHILFFSFFSCVSTVDEANLGKEGGRCLRGNTCEYDTLICIEGKCRLDMCQNVTCLNTWEKCDYKDGFCHPKNNFCSSDSDCNLKNNEYCSDNHLCRVSNCTGKSCAELSIECGITNDGCGNLDCGRCESGKFCNLGICEISSCIPKTCESLSTECGIIDDGCENTIDCGICETGKACIDGVCKIESGICENGSERLGTTICGLNNEGVFRQLCVSGEWKDSSVCTGADICVNGSEEVGITVCGLNDEGRHEQDCIDGQWVESLRCTGTDICVNGDKQTGTTVCGLNNEGFYKQNCINGQWIDNDDCTGTDECMNGDERIGTTVCGLNNEGYYKQSCSAGQWVDHSDCTGRDECINGEVVEEFCGSGDIQGHMMILCDLGHWMELEGCICDEGYEWNEAMDRCELLCVPNSCSNLEAECGVIDDGCGVVVDCGTCDVVDTCNENNICIPPEDGELGGACNNDNDCLNNAYCLYGKCYEACTQISDDCSLNGYGCFKRVPQNIWVCREYGDIDTGEVCARENDCISDAVCLGLGTESEFTCYEKCDAPDYDCTMDGYSCVESSDPLFGSFCFPVSEIGEHCGSTSDDANYYCVSEAKCLSYNEGNSFTCYEKCETANYSCYIDGYDCKNTGSAEYGWLCLP